VNEERLRILQMVADGKINPEDAEGLLAALEPAMPPPVPAGAPLPPLPPLPPPFGARAGTTPPGVAQRLHIILHGEDGDEVDVTCPVALAKTASHLMPENARGVLEKFGLDLEPILESISQGVPPGNLIKARTEDGDELEIKLE